MGVYYICVTLFLSGFLLGCNAYSTGMPPGACSRMKPAHQNNEPQRSNSPYTVNAVRNGEKVRIKIFSNTGDDFKGFALQARSSANRAMMINGQFTVDSSKSQAIDCHDGTKNTLTHIDKFNKGEIVTDWTPSDILNENVVFRATVVKNYNTFWTDIDSSPISVQNEVSRAGAGSRAGTRQSQKSDSGTQDLYNGCFETKGCFGLPSGCIDSANCEVLLAYSRTDDGITFQMSGMLQQANYMAMGLSMDASMGDDSVTECFMQQSNVVARKSRNLPEYKNTLNRELLRDEYNGAFTDGIATCSWTSSYQTEGNNFDVVNSNYHILLAKGLLQNDGSLGYHYTTKLATQEPVNFTHFDSLTAEGLGNSIKIHGDTVMEETTAVSETSTKHNGQKSISGDSLAISVVLLLAIAQLALMI